MFNFTLKRYIKSRFWVLFLGVGGTLCGWGLLAPQPGPEPMPPSVQVWNLNLLTGRELPNKVLFLQTKLIQILMLTAKGMNNPNVYQLING